MAEAAPYVGPRAFLPGEMLYGRDREIADLRDLLIAERVVLFYSPSGAGKTSLLQAGLRGALLDKGFEVLAVARVSYPAGLTAPNRYGGSILASLGDAPGPSLIEGLERHLAEGRRTVLILDQFEEVFTLDTADEPGRDAFFAQLADALEAYPRLWLVLAMREDYLALLDRHRDWLPTRLRCHYRLDLLDPTAASRAIRLPAERCGVDFTKSAAALLVDDLRRLAARPGEGVRLGSHVEPLHLQIACLKLWERCSKRWEQDPSWPRDIVDDDVETGGGTDQALADYYDDKMRRAADAASATVPDPVVAERELREWVRKKLIVPPGIRAQVPEGEQGRGTLTRERIAPLRDAYLVRLEERRGDEWYELSHDRLIPPIQASNEAWFERNLHGLQNLAALWTVQPKAEYLLADDDLRDAKEWAETHPTRVTSEEREFLAACGEAEGKRKEESASAERQKRTKQTLLLVAIIAVILGAGATVLIFKNAQLNGELRNVQDAKKVAETTNIEANIRFVKAKAELVAATSARLRSEDENRRYREESELRIRAQEKLANLKNREAEARLAEAERQIELANITAVKVSKDLTAANLQILEAQAAKLEADDAIQKLSEEKDSLNDEKKQLAEKNRRSDEVIESVRAIVRDAPDSELVRAIRARLQSVATSTEDDRKDRRVASGTAPVRAEKAPATSIRAKLWKPGATLRVRFLNGTAMQRARAMEAASEWSRDANIRFVESSDADAELRVEFGRGSWSYIGIDALGIRATEPTMMLPDWNGSGRPPDMHSALHEFGHALGLIHENSNPNGEIPWNIPEVKRYYRGFTDDLIQNTILQKARISDYRKLDPDSVMWYGNFPRELFTRDFRVGGDGGLSKGDKDFIAQLYPGRP